MKNTKYWADKGIKVCDEWNNDFLTFYRWAMENGYSDNLTIDRIDSNKNYEPSNCRWATYKQQANNLSSNHKIEINGEIHNVSEWCRIYGITPSTVYLRVRKYGWDFKKAITEPRLKLSDLPLDVKEKRKNISAPVIARKGTEEIYFKSLKDVSKYGFSYPIVCKASIGKWYKNRQNPYMYKGYIWERVKANEESKNKSN